MRNCESCGKKAALITVVVKGKTNGSGDPNPDAKAFNVCPACADVAK